MREYGIDLLRDDMSWRRFCVLYSALSPASLVCLNYDRVAGREGRDGAGEESAWEMLTGLSKPDGKELGIRNQELGVTGEY